MYMGNYVHHHQVHHVHVPPCTPCAIFYTITMFIMYMCTTRVPPSPLILLRRCLIRQMRSGHSFYGECELIANDDFNMVFCFVFNWIKMLHILVLISCSPCLTKSSSIKDSKFCIQKREENTFQNISDSHCYWHLRARNYLWPSATIPQIPDYPNGPDHWSVIIVINDKPLPRAARPATISQFSSLKLESIKSQ